MGYIVPFLTISSILIDISFTNLIFIGAMFNSYNSWYLLSLPSSFTLHYSILFLIISVILYSLISCYFRCYIKFSLYVLILYLLCTNVKLTIHLSLLILSSFFSNSTFFIPIFLDFFIIFLIFFFKGPINSIEVFTSFNSCYSILFINFLVLFFQIQFIILVIIDNTEITATLNPKLPLHKSTLPNTESIKPNTAIGSPKLIYLIYLFSMLYLEVGA